MSATVSSTGFSQAFTISGFSFGGSETISSSFKSSIAEVPKIQSMKSSSIPSGLVYDHIRTILLPRLASGVMNTMPVPTTSPLTVGWAIGLTAALIVSALGIAGGTLAILHTDINDVRSEVSSVRDGASDDNQNLRNDMRQDLSQVNLKLDRITGMLTDIKVDQARTQEKK